MALRYSLLCALAAIIVIGYLQGCGGIAKKEEATFASNTESDSVRKAALYRQYGEWKGTKYRLGGSSKWGVDHIPVGTRCGSSPGGIKAGRSGVFQNRGRQKACGHLCGEAKISPRLGQQRRHAVESR